MSEENTETTNEETAETAKAGSKPGRKPGQKQVPLEDLKAELALLTEANLAKLEELATLEDQLDAIDASALRKIRSTIADLTKRIAAREATAANPKHRGRPAGSAAAPESKAPKVSIERMESALDGVEGLTEEMKAVILQRMKG